MYRAPDTSETCAVSVEGRVSRPPRMAWSSLVQGRNLTNEDLVKELIQEKRVQHPRAVQALLKVTSSCKHPLAPVDFCRKAGGLSWECCVSLCGFSAGGQEILHPSRHARDGCLPSNCHPSKGWDNCMHGSCSLRGISWLSCWRRMRPFL